MEAQSPMGQGYPFVVRQGGDHIAQIAEMAVQRGDGQLSFTQVQVALQQKTLLLL